MHMSTCCFTGQSQTHEISWKSPRLCRWEITDGMFRLRSCETGILCSDGVEQFLRADPCRYCLVIPSGGGYSQLNKRWWEGMCLPGQQENKTVLQQGSVHWNVVVTGCWGRKCFWKEIVLLLYIRLLNTPTLPPKPLCNSSVKTPCC